MNIFGGIVHCDLVAHGIILCDKHTKVMVQGIGRAGTFHAEQCIAYGTQVVAGVSPGKGGQRLFDRPVFDTAEDAVAKTGANCSLIFVPAPSAPDAILEAAAAGADLIICITEGIATLDMVRVKRALEGQRCRIIGPNCPGVITPGQAKIGIMPGYIHRPGNIGVISRSSSGLDPVSLLGPGLVRLPTTSTVKPPRSMMPASGPQS